tara:strand:+ start:51 stop:341 length:291 start_codon:yes stop_codon:yes gene_type:complete
MKLKEILKEQLNISLLKRNIKSALDSTTQAVNNAVLDIEAEEERRKRDNDEKDEKIKRFEDEKASRDRVPASKPILKPTALQQKTGVGTSAQLPTS